MENSTSIDKLVDERVKQLLPLYLKTTAFTDRKLTDNPTDSLQVVNRKFVTLNGLVANRPASSVATIGQFYLATDTNIPMWYTTTGWRNGAGSVVAQA